MINNYKVKIKKQKIKIIISKNYIINYMNKLIKWNKNNNVYLKKSLLGKENSYNKISNLYNIFRELHTL